MAKPSSSCMLRNTQPLCSVSVVIIAGLAQTCGLGSVVNAPHGLGTLPHPIPAKSGSAQIVTCLARMLLGDVPRSMNAQLLTAGTTPAPSISGLSTTEARHRLQTVGPNDVPDTTVRPLRSALSKFWAPVPWMLEAAIVLQLLLGKNIEAAIIAALLVFNAVLGFFQESRAQATLTALKSKLALSASVRRDGIWKT